ncbi:MAG: ethanolamine utilization protein EutJ, partial [Clostridia bacterium]|nr:ethanolamine utilization protein EutJ [Clostridia bacterium]
MKKVLAIVLALVLALSLMSIATAEKAGDGLTIGIVYQQSGNAYFQAGVSGFAKAAEELGF